MAQTRWRPPDKPRLRQDLQMKRAKQGSGYLYKVKTPESQSICMLQEVEISVLKLMNGERDLAGIAKESSAQGLPMTTEQLEKFIRELAAYKFIENADALPPWTAESSVERNEPVAPTQPEGELFSSLAARPIEGKDESGRWANLMTGAFEATGRAWDRLRAWAAPVLRNARDRASSLTARVRKDAGPTWSRLTDRVSDFLSPLEKRLSPYLNRIGLKNRRARLIGLGGLGLVLIVAVALAFSRSPARASYPCQISDLRMLEVRAPYEGVVAEVSVHEGQTVSRGDLLGRLDADAMRAEVDRLDTALLKFQDELALMRKGTDPNEVDDAKAQIQKYQKQFAALKKAKGLSKPERAEKTAALNKQIGAARARLSLMLKANEPGAIVRKEMEAEEIRKNKKRAEDALANLDIRAPASGKVTASLPPSRAKTALKPNEVFARIVPAVRIGAVVSLPEKDQGRVAVGAPVRFRPESHPNEVLEGTIVAVESPRKVEAELQDRDGVLSPGMKGSALVELSR